MYLQSNAACSLPNSVTPMSQSAIDEQNAFIAAVGDYFNSGNVTMGQLIAALGGNPVAGSPSVAGGTPGAVTGGDAGVPTVGDPYSFLSPGVLPSAPSAPGAPGTAAHGRRYQIIRRNMRLFGGGPGGGGLPLGVPQSLRDARRRSQSMADGVSCAPPQVFPLMTVFPIPVAPAPTATIPAPVAIAAPPPAPAIAAAPAPAQTPRPIPSTGNTCADLTLGLITADQADPRQNLYCANNGYQGAHAPPGWVIQAQIAQSMAGTLPKIPFQSSPPNTDPAGYPSQYYPFVQKIFAETGFSGFGAAPATPSSSGAWALLILAAGAMYAFSKGKQ